MSRSTAVSRFEYTRVLAGFALLALLVAGAAPAAAQGWDTSGNGLLKGQYYFRHVAWVVGDNYGDLSQASTLYGTVTFDGAGNYTMAAVAYDSNYGSSSGTLTGTYSIAASGYGFISNPLSNGDSIYGLVSAGSVFVGSSTDNQSGFNDMFVAAPLTSQSMSTFKGTYNVAYLDPVGGGGGSPLGAISAMFPVSPDGAGNLGNVSITGYVGQYGSQVMTQSASRVTYVFSNGAYNISFPSNGSMLAGSEYVYISPDGNFVFGGSPQGWDFFVGVKTGTGTPSFNGLFYQAGVDLPIDSNGIGYLDSFYGAANGANGSNIGHQRVAGAFNSMAYDYTYHESFSLGSDGTYKDSQARYSVGAGGTIRVGSGIGPSLGLSVALAAPAMSGSGVFLNPQGVVNGGSWAPFTASIVPGEFITLVGSGLAPAGLAQASTVPFPTQLGPVQVMINGIAAPLYYTTPGQISAIVPYGITGAVAQIQVINGSSTSNTVTSFIGLTAPGVFTQSQSGVGYGSIQHTDYSLVTPANPAQPGQTLFVYLTGLGAMNPAVNDGAAAPSDSLVNTSNAITASIGGIAATASFAGLVPGAVSLGQVNVQVPSTATAGDAVLAISGPDSYSEEALIPVGTASVSASAVQARTVPRQASHTLKPRHNTRRVN